MMLNFQSYPTTVLNERMCHSGGSKHTLTLPTYLQGVKRRPQLPGSLPLDCPAVICLLRARTEFHTFEPAAEADRHINLQVSS